MRIRAFPQDEPSEQPCLQDLASIVEDLSALLKVDREELISELTALLRRRAAFEALKRRGRIGRDDLTGPLA